ncbi:Endoglucanase-1 [Grifola frondosa]|uniref:Endoglucanase-1 n=1 Tax=Grifola frondosa TaxID=5627 RepID=A0A1C7M587_GRIFR|nr:Endoglucanase-1 [Grifola frondosa]
MADPTKAETEQVFKVLKAQKGNKIPDRVIVDGTVELSSTPTPPAGDEDDFFSSWNKPATPKPTETASARSTPPPMIGRSVSASSAPAAPASRTVSSSSLRANSSSTVGSRPTSKLGASRLNSSTTTATSTTAAPKKAKLGGLGAKKAAAPIDFAEAERRAAAEAERVRQLGYDREREKAEEEERARQEVEKSAAATQPKGNAHDMERLGMGMKRLGFGAVPVAAVASTSSSAGEDAPTYAREKFGNQKAISSDMYFGRNSYDPAAVSEAQTRLQSFQGASSISSNQYFGRDEEEEIAGMGHGTDGGILGDGTLAGLELAERMRFRRYWRTQMCRTWVPRAAFGRLSVFVALAASAAAQTLTGPFDCLPAGSFTLCQNLWGRTAGVGSQNSTLISTSGNSISWLTDYTWAEAPNNVKSYANVLHNTAMGMQWSYEVESSGIRADVSYDIWTGVPSSGSPASSASSFEIMIWLSGLGGIQPVGSQIVSGISLAGYTWNLWRGPNANWQVLSFVSADGNINDFNADLKDFFDYLIANQGVASTQFLQAIQTGTEPFVGNATLLISNYSVDVQV